MHGRVGMLFVITATALAGCLGDDASGPVPQQTQDPTSPTPQPFLAGPVGEVEAIDPIATLAGIALVADCDALPIETIDPLDPLAGVAGDLLPVAPGGFFEVVFSSEETIQEACVTFDGIQHGLNGTVPVASRMVVYADRSADYEVRFI